MSRDNPMGNRKGKKGNKAQNIFALITNNRQDRSWRGMKELYHFNSNAELAEYSLPIVSIDKDNEEEKYQPGVVNVGGVNVKMGTKANKLEPISHASHMSASEREILEEAGEGMDEYEGEGEGEEVYSERSLDSQELEEMIEKVDDKAENELAMAKNSMFIEKNTPLYRQRAEIKTGEDAISFFAKHGNNTPIKIFNCNRAKVAPGVFRPYDLEVVLDEKQLNEEYFTISNRGVVHVFKKNTKRMSDEEMVPTEFLFASDWMHEATLFNVLTSMKFFKTYLIGKVYNSWKANVRYKKFVRTREKLAKNLKFMRPAFQPSFMEINSTLYEMQKVKCFKETKVNKTYRLEEDFIPDQKKGRDDAKTHYENKITEITNKLVELINEVSESKNIRDEEDFENSKIGQKVKHKAMTVQKKEEQTKRDVLKIARKNISNLGTFIRLIDYMVVETQVKINQDSANMVYAEMCQDDRKAGITTEIKYCNEGGMLFTPADTDFVNQFDRMLQEMVSAAKDVTRIINNHHFSQYTQGIVSDSGPDFIDIVSRSEAYDDVQQKIRKKFVDDFAQLHKDSANFEDCREVYKFVEDFKFEEFKNQGNDLPTIQDHLDKLRKWEMKVATVIKAQIIRGLIYGNGKTLRDDLSNKVRSNLHKIRNYLEQLTLVKQQDIIDRLKKIQKGLKLSMGTLSEYVEYVKNLNMSKEEMKTLENEKTTVEEMMGILKKSNKAKQEMNSLGSSSSSGGDPTVQIRYENILQDLVSCGKQIGEKDGEVLGDIEEKVVELNTSIEEVKEKMKEYIDKIDRDKLIEASTPSEEALKELIDRIKNKFDPYRKTAHYNMDAQKILGQQQTEIPEIEEFDRKWEARHKLWKMRNDWDTDYNIWFNQVFQGQDSLEIEKKLKEYEKDLTWLKQNLPRDKTDEVYEKLHDDIKGTSSMKDLILDLGNKALLDRHWNKIFVLLPEGSAYASSRTFTLNELIKDGILEVKDKVSEISGLASGEYAISQTLEEVKKTWAGMEFIIVPYREFKDKFILGSIEEIMIQLEDDQVSVQTMLSSKNVKEIRDDVTVWQIKLSYISDVIDDWLACQRQWMYLENIFNAEDIQKQLPNESKLFKKVDKFWRDIMTKTHRDPSILNTCDSEGLLRRFQSNNKMLEEIQKCLEDYLETKRSAFPRFYFLSNDELLQILSQTRNPQAVQPHLRKCFDNMASIVFTEEKKSKSIVAMISADGERVEFSETVMAEGNVEFWLTNIEKMMVKSLYDQNKQTWEDYPEDALERREWFFTHPAQCVLAIDQVYWTKGCTEAIEEIEKGKNKKALSDWLDFIYEQVGKMVEVVRGDLTNHQRTLMGAIIVLDVHAREVVKKMVDVKVNNIDNFEWSKQLRYYWEEEDDDCFARQTNTRFRYGYEFLGNGPRLVITPLTDKCYMTLTGALHLNYGGNPQGPAGTGKTESTKDLAKALAIQCVVFNCSDGLDYKMMARFFSGLAQGGAWSCFDEFNRIGIEVLSVIAQQMLTIQTAVKAKKDKFFFIDKEIPLNRRFGVFITMNPGYAGRTELPDNLKALFRPVSMMIPDYALIAEIILFSEGFEYAFELARKMVQLYKLSSEQLSKQKHYDFGMRAVKSVLVMAGALRRKEPDSKEEIVLIRAMRDSNVPKFLEHDLPLFNGIITDLFPGVEVKFIDYGNVQTKIEENLKKRKYQLVPKLIKKTIQLLETMLVRHGNMIVGEAATGKTTICEVLADALTDLHADGSRERMHCPVEQYRLNPKAVSRDELFGYVDLLTNEWTDGLVSKLVNDAVESDKPDNLKWIIYDGPVDALWIENMNTVLDDNKTLCLNNGQRIKLPPTVTMIFEVMDLKVASPATVSRCGMVYLEPVHLGWQPLIDTWKAKMSELDPDCAIYYDQACKIIESVFKKGLKFIREECQEVIASVDNNLVMSCLNLLESVMDPENKKVDLKRAVSPENDVKVYTIFSTIWSLGANLFDDSRKNFNRFMKSRIIEIDCDFPDEGQVYDYGIEPTTHSFESWGERVQKFEYNPEASFFSILVPTSDTVKYKFMLDTLLSHSHNVLISGDTGVGKSVITSDYLVKTDAENYASGFINFSGKTTSNNLKDAFESKLEKKRKTLLGPPGGRKMIFFIDDVNMPQYDEFFSQPPVELLRQTIDSGGFYDLDILKFKEVKDTQFVTACAPPGGGRNEVTPRLFRHFNMIWIPALSKKSMELIFSSVLRGFLELGPGSKLDIFAEPVVRASVDIYEKTIKDFLPTPTKSHYTFNLRDMSKVVQGILQIDHKNLDDKDMLVSIWVHEIFRVFRDRLINQQDIDKFNDIVTKLMQKHLNVDWEKSQFVDILFGDYDCAPDKDYMKLNEPEELVPRLNEFLESYNVYSTTPMNLVFFNDAIFHLSRISRILRSQRGNALLVGVGGSGRRSLATLAAHMQDMTCFSIEISKNYREKEWHEDIKSLLFEVGAENKQKVFIFSDSQIINESFLEDINNLLNAGEVPNLFEQDEFENIVDTLRPYAKTHGLEGRDEILHFFTSLCRQNLHITLAFSPVGEKFRERCRQFPSIINCCTIDWYQKWPAEALYSVADRFFTEKEVELNIDEYKEALCRMAVEIHNSAGEEADNFYDELRRKTYTTPKSYLDLIKCYLEMMTEQSRIVPENIARYSQGLRLLAQIKTMVDQLQVTLTKLRPEIDQKEEETQKLVVDLEKQQQSAAETEKVFKVEAEESQKLFDNVQELRNDCQQDLDKAMPIYQSALKALKTLKKDDIVEMKSYPSPPDEVVMVVSGVCVLFKKAENWDEGKKLMTEPKKFLSSMENYDKDNIPEKIIKKLRKYIKMSKFKPDIIAKKSKAGESICKWVIAMVEYSDVMKIIKPKKASLKKAEVELDKAKTILAEKEASLQKIRDKIALLQSNYNASLRTLEDLTKQKELIEVQLVRAEKLLNGLESESKRWEKSVEELNVDLHDLVGNIMVAAACCQYVGPFTNKYRNKLKESWIRFCTQNNIPISNNLSLERILADPVTIREWNLNGLPADTLSIENGIYTTNAQRWPLLIDPQSQANRWIKKEEGLQVVKQSQGKYLQTLENAIRLGTPVLIENAGEELDPALEPILLKQLYKSQGQLVIKLGENEIPYAPEFSLKITTKLPNPHYLPEVCIKVTIINFTVTPEGLEDQLLVDVVRYERPDLEEQKDQLITKSAELKRQLKEIEDKILKLVSEADDEILNDEELINTLEQSKETSVMINQRMKEAEQMTKEINANRELYRDVAIRGSVLYFVIASVALMDPMYQYSLAFFSQLFNRRLAKSTKSDVLEERLQILIDDITIQFYKNICRGIFEKDKLTYSFLNATSILIRENRITPDEMNFFTRGPAQLEEDKNPTDFADDLYFKLCALEGVHSNFLGMKDSLSDAADVVYWKDLISSEDPGKLSFPSKYEDTLTEFQKLIIRKLIREENLLLYVKEFIRRELSAEFIESPPFDLPAAYSDSTSISPLIFILSPGADPIPNLQNLAKQFGMEDKLKILSLGQGQGPIAEKFIEGGQANGEWICLQNCHLSSSWMPELERIQEAQDEGTTSPEYRLWLTSMPTTVFPVPVLQSGIKLTNEPPKGLKANLKRTFNEITEDQYEECSKPKEYKKMLFALAYFHAVILERRKFGAIGWNISYEWMNSDFFMSEAQLRMFLDQQPEVPYTALNYLVAEINYGGRVTDDKDVELIKSLLKKYFTPDILRDEYKLSLLDTYYAPKEGSLDLTKEYINTLPLEDDPEIFGLHPNANITFKKKTVNEFLNMLILIQPRSSSKGAAAATPEEIVATEAARMLNLVPEVLDTKRAHENSFIITENGAMESLGVFLQQEIDRFNILLRVMKKTLFDLGEAIKGTVVMSLELEKMFNDILDKKVPGNWEDVGYPSLKPLGSWMDDLISRIEFMSSWLYEGPPKSYMLPAFFFPQGFMTASLQTYSRKNEIAIDTLKFKTHVRKEFNKDIKEGPEFGVNVHGLYLQGARWNISEGKLADSKKGVLFVELPIIWLEPISEDVKDDERAYKCPLYKTSLRKGELSTTGHSTNFIMYLALHTEQKPEFWINRGVALLCQLDD